jgi:hypothetical protein
MHRTLFLALGIALFCGSSAATHHGNAVYDTSRSVTVSGTVTKWQLVNPHSGLWIEAKTDAGAVTVWSAEFGGVLDLYRRLKWNRQTFTPGDKVTMIGSPARNGSSAMLARKIVFADGREVDLSGT